MPDPVPTLPPAVDWDAARRHIPDGDEGIRFVAGLLLEDLPRRVAALRSALAEDHAVEARLEAHSIKGSVLHFGAVEAASAALAIERLAAAGDLRSAAAALPALDRALARLVVALRSFQDGGRPAEL